VLKVSLNIKQTNKNKMARHRPPSWILKFLQFFSKIKNIAYF